MLGQNNEPVWYQGYVKNRHESSCFVSCPDLRYNLFVRAQQIPDEQWLVVKPGTQGTREPGVLPGEAPRE